MKARKQCFLAFLKAHKKDPFNAVICANDFAAVSLLVHLRSEGMDADKLRIAVHSNARLLRYFPEIISAKVDYTAVASAALRLKLTRLAPIIHVADNTPVVAAGI